MMDPSNINSFEDQWKKALNEASETPPPSVWAGIEARLDKEEVKVVPLWWQSPKMWYAAASMAALMLVGGGLWYLGVHDEQAGMAAKTQEAPAATHAPAFDSARVADAGNASQSPSNGISATQSGNVDAARSASGANGPEENGISSTSRIASSSRGPVRAPRVIGSNSIADAPSVAAALKVEAGQPAAPAVTEVPNALAAAAKVTRNETAAASADEAVSAEMLASLPYNDLDVYVQKRHVFFRPEVAAEEPVVEVKKPKEYYAGIGVMPASFNPDVQLKEAPMAFSAQSVSQRRAVSGSSEARASYAVQTQGGVRLSKHWSVETGVSYLRGNSAYEGGGYMLNAYNSAAANVLENALAGVPSASPSFDKSADFNGGALYIDVAKKVSNNYQYLQLPVQAGFTLNPDKKFSYSLLGGMMANFFLVNELESATGEIIRTTASDEIYRGMNWAATTGLRLNYKLSGNWAANLTGSYQKAVSSGFRANQSLDSHPYLYGVSWSVRYSF